VRVWLRYVQTVVSIFAVYANKRPKRSEFRYSGPGGDRVALTDARSPRHDERQARDGGKRGRHKRLRDGAKTAPKAQIVAQRPCFVVSPVAPLAGGAVRGGEGRGRRKQWRHPLAPKKSH